MSCASAALARGHPCPGTWTHGRNVEPNMGPRTSGQRHRWFGRLLLGAVAIGCAIGAVACTSESPTRTIRGHRVAVIEAAECDDHGSCVRGLRVAGDDYALNGCLRPDFARGRLVAVASRAASVGFTEARAVGGVDSKVAIAARTARLDPTPYDCRWFLAVTTGSFRVKDMDTHQRRQLCEAMMPAAGKLAGCPVRTSPAQ